MPSLAAAQIAAAAQPDANRGDAFMLVALGGSLIGLSLCRRWFTGR
jgi:hypothetical protein